MPVNSYSDTAPGFLPVDRPAVPLHVDQGGMHLAWTFRVYEPGLWLLAEAHGVPHAHDQFDNAERLARLGVARTLLPRRYTPGRVAAALRRLLDDPAYGRRASDVGERVAGRERGDGRL